MPEDKLKTEKEFLATQGKYIAYKELEDILYSYREFFQRKHTEPIPETITPTDDLLFDIKERLSPRLLKRRVDEKQTEFLERLLKEFNLVHTVVDQIKLKLKEAKNG